jgi:hypothetical protein
MKMIAKFFAPLICYLFGHDKFYPHPNRRIWGCARCENGPDDWNYKCNQIR